MYISSLISSEFPSQALNVIENVSIYFAGLEINLVPVAQVRMLVGAVFPRELHLKALVWSIVILYHQVKYKAIFQNLRDFRTVL